MKTLNHLLLNPYYSITDGSVGYSVNKPWKQPINTSKASSSFMRRFFNLIKSQIDDPNLSVTRVAKALHVSTIQLYRKVKKSSGIGPNQFIRAIRLQRGRQLLLTTDWNIAEIAYAVGFNDPNYFTRSFTREFKRSPSQYRSQELKPIIYLCSFQKNQGKISHIP